MSGGLSSCPKCGFHLASPADSCPKCGVVFAKLATARHAVRASDVLVSTGELPCDYEVIGPVYCQVSNKGIFSSHLDKLAAKYNIPVADAGWDATAWGFLFLGEFPVGQQQFQRAFAVCVEELKRQALKLGGDAVTWLRQDVDLDTTAFQFFYMQAYGTAVRRK
jgi:hypothetical protein